MARKIRRRPVHYVTFAYRDGAVISCTPDRKPIARKVKEDGLYIDDDLVYKEYQFGCDEFRQWELDQRVRTSNVLANRLNMRRTVRELVLPELVAIQTMLSNLAARLESIENSIAN